MATLLGEGDEISELSYCSLIDAFGRASVGGRGTEKKNYCFKVTAQTECQHYQQKCKLKKSKRIATKLLKFAKRMQKCRSKLGK